MARKFSNYFTLEELCYSSTAVRLKINNSPSLEETRNLKGLTKNLLDPIREAIGFPIRVNSGFRNAATNKAVGGVSTSAHQYGLAADIVCTNYKNGNVREFALFIEKWLKDNNVAFDQLIYEKFPNSEWVHIGWKNPKGEQRKQVLTIKGKFTLAGIKA